MKLTPAMRDIVQIIRDGAASAMTLEQIIQAEIGEWQTSKKRTWMNIGDLYYRNKTDILERVRTAIGESGAKEIVGNLANNKMVHGFIRKLVDQKVGYLLSRPLSIQTDKEAYQALLMDYFDKSTLKLLQNLGKEAINKGLSWLHVYYDEEGTLSAMKIPSEEIIPLWRDAAHTELDAVIRVYEVEAYDGMRKTTLKKVEWWDTNGVRRYVQQGGLIPDVEAGEVESHFSAVAGNQKRPLNWERVPFIAFKYNDDEQPLVELIKSLVDDYDARKSDNANNLEDLPNSVYVVKNYGGTDAGEFRKNISVYRVVFVEGEGGVDTIALEIDTEAYKDHMDRNRRDIYEFGRGVDTQSDKFGGDQSGIALKFLYADLDMDANIIETEFQASLEQLRWFIDVHIANTTGADYSAEQVDFILNRDILINESDTILNAKNSTGIISKETIVANHPWVTDVQEELDRIKTEQEDEMKQFADGYDQNGGVPPNGGAGDG